MALTDEDFELLGSLRGMRVFATTLQEIVNDCRFVVVGTGNPRSWYRVSG
ncbi:hypothetical protein ACL1B5_14250 [Corynebacterium striatum]